MSTQTATPDSSVGRKDHKRWSRHVSNLGLLLFMMVKIADVPLKDLVRDVMPFLWVMIGALALMTFIPEIVLFLPRLMGYKG